MAHTGSMIALVPTDVDAQRLMIDGGEDADQLHITLMYLGEAAMLPQEVRDSLVTAVERVITELPTVIGKIFSVNVFNPTPGESIVAAGGSEPCVTWSLEGELLTNAHNLIVPIVNEVFASYMLQPYQQHDPWIPHITAAYISSDDEVDLAPFTNMLGPVTFDRVRLAFGDEVYDIPLGNSASNCNCSDTITATFDLNQPRDEHGRWTEIGNSDTADVITTLPNVKVYSKSQAGRDTWLSTDNIAQRSATLWAETFGGQQAIRQAVKNIRRNNDPLSNVDLDNIQLKRIYSKKRGKTPYTRDDIGADIVRAASWIISEQDNAQPSGVIYRGMRVEDPSKLVVGEHISGHAVSWSPSSDTADTYATDPHGPNGEWNARQKWKPVMITGTGFHGANIGDNTVGRLAGQQSEIVANDEFIIESVEEYDRTKHGMLFISYNNNNMPLIVTVRPV